MKLSSIDLNHRNTCNRWSIIQIFSRGVSAILDKLRSADFLPYQNQNFRISVDSGAQLDVELVEVTDLGAPGATTKDEGKRRPFSLVFSGPMEPVWPQGIYRLEHDKFEAFRLFFVPIGPDSKGMRYEVVFT